MMMIISMRMVVANRSSWRNHDDDVDDDDDNDEDDNADDDRGVIGDIIHYFTLMSSKLTLFALFFIFRHYSLFFQKYENNVINSLQFSKTFDYFRKILCEIQLFLQERFAHKALGLLLTAQSAFDREWDGLTRLLWTLFKHALTVFNTVLACFYSIKHCFVAKR